MKICNFWQQIKVAQRDVIKALIFVLSAFVITLQTNLAELLTEKLSKFEEFQLDEIPFLILFIAMALAWFAWRRVIEQKKEIELRLIAEDKSTQLLLENKSLTQHILKVQEFERLELARDLHDDIGQYLLAIRLDASSLTVDGDADSHPARRILSNAGHIQNMAKSLMRRLRPAPTNSKNCIDGIHLMVQEWLERQPNIHVILSINESVRFFSDQTLEKDADFIELISVTIYRFLQEALTNIAKHAQANQVEISLNIVKKNPSSEVEHLCLEIRDDGKGLDTNVATSTGMGMIGMRERINAVNGEYFVRNNSPKGLVVCAKIPIKLISAIS